MNDAYKQLQQEYIAAMRAVTPDIVAWWDARCPYRWTEPVPAAATAPFHRRWPAGPAGHPRIIGIFRQYFFAIDDLNDQHAAANASGSDGEDHDVWGEDVPPPDIEYVRPADLLIDDLANAAPDVYEIMQGFVFVPIGSDPEGGMC
ncbi:hypothetical protein [Caballeronia sp. RCC_10]|uniref:hypothetical protein n=1 Tax=Caballeronia sp. RCC_10 TaxID=3239227 RepID=UPI003524B8DA